MKTSIVLFVVLIFSSCQGFLLHTNQFPRANAKTTTEHHQKTPPDDDMDAGHFKMDDSLRPPLINLRRESILFGTNSATMANNNVLSTWQWIRRRFPVLLTGTRSDENPGGALYNTFLVRLPTLVAGVIYGKNLVQGHGLIVDLGGGPLEVNPLVVFAILGSVLRVPKQPS